MFILEFPQNILGFIAFLLLTKTGRRPYKKYKDAYAVHVAGAWGAVTLSKYVFADDNYYHSEMIKHEYGHRLQSRLLCFLYMPLIGLPSLIWAGIFRLLRIKNFRSYFHFYTEAWANRLGELNLK